LFGVKLTNGDNRILIAGSNGKTVLFNEKDVRIMGRSASGVKGFDTDGSTVVGVATDKEGANILSVTRKGYGKKTPLSEYRETHRGAKGVKTVNITEKNGELISLKAVNGDEDLLIITNKGVIIRISLNKVSTYGRNSQGVKLINVDENTEVSSVEVVAASEEETQEETENA